MRPLRRSLSAGTKLLLFAFTLSAAIHGTDRWVMHDTCCVDVRGANAAGPLLQWLTVGLAECCSEGLKLCMTGYTAEANSSRTG